MALPKWNFRALTSVRPERATTESRAEYIERLWKRIEQSTELTTKILQEIQGIPQDISPDELDERIERLFETSDLDSPYDEFAAAHRSHGLRGALARHQHMPGEKGFRSRSKMRSKLRQTNFSPEREASKKISGILANLIQKYYQVRQLESGGTEKAITALQDELRKRKKSLPTTAVNEVRFGAFDVIYYLDPTAFKKVSRKLGPDTIGLHYPQTPFCLVSNKGNTQAIVRHERVHNLISGFTLNRRHDFSDALADLRKDTEIHSMVDENTEDTALKVTDFLDGLHEELLAELENAEQRNFGLTPDPQINFQNLSSYASTATAGSDVKRAIDALRNPPKRLKSHPHLKAYETQLATRIEQGFHRILQGANTAYEIARRISDPQALTYFHAGCLVLRPTQWPRLSELLRRKYGPAFEEARAQQEYERSIEDSDPALQRLVYQIADAEKPKPTDLELFENFLIAHQDEPYELFPRFGIFVISDFEALDEAIKQYPLEKRGLLADIVSRMESAFITNVIEELCKKGGAKLSAFRDDIVNARHNQEETFDYMLKNHLEDSLEMDLADLPELPKFDWEEFRKLGIEAEVREIVERVQSERSSSTANDD